MMDAVSIAKQRLADMFLQSVETQATFVKHYDQNNKHYRYNHTERGRETSRQRHARYRAKPENKKKIAAYRHEYYLLHREQELAKAKAWKENNKKAKLAEEKK